MNRIERVSLSLDKTSRMSLRCQTPLPFLHRAQTHNKLELFPFRDEKRMKKMNESLISINLRLSHVPTLRCSSSNTSVSAMDSDDESPKPSLYIKGLSKSTSEGRVKKMFAEFGVVKQVKLLVDEDSGESLGIAYVWYANENYTELAVKQMNGKFFDGKFISVSLPRGTFKGPKKARRYRF